MYDAMSIKKAHIDHMKKFSIVLFLLNSLTWSVRLTKSKRSHVPITKHPNISNAERQPNKTDACLRRTSATCGSGISFSSPLIGYLEKKKSTR